MIGGAGVRGYEAARYPGEGYVCEGQKLGGGGGGAKAPLPPYPSPPPTGFAALGLEYSDQC